MKFKLLSTCLLFVGIFCSAPSNAQTEKGFNYQAVARDASGDAILNTAVTIRIEIHETTAGGGVVYDETHNPVTNEHGLFTIVVGEGSVNSGNFSNIDWGGDDHFLEVSMNAVSMGTQELEGVPYAKWAKNGSKWGTNLNGIHYDSGNVGIGIDLPTKVLHVEGDPVITQDLVFSEVKHTMNVDSRAIYGRSQPVDGWGIAIDGVGGYMGVRATNSTGAYTGTSYGVRSSSTGTAGTRYGVYSTAGGTGVTNTYGVYGNGTSGNNVHGVYGLASASGGSTAYGVRGYANSATNNYAIYGTTGSSGTNHWAGYFSGNVQVVNGDEAGLTTNGFLELGPTTGSNLVLDANEITARSNGAESTLYLQPNQGDVHIGTTGVWGARLHVAGSGTQEIFRCQDGGTTRFLIDEDGDVRIGSYAKATGHRLSVDGKVACEEVLVELSGSWPDYVFEAEYELAELQELKRSITDLGHLPGLPSAQSVEEDGQQLGEIQKQLLEKIEELTLYMINADERILDLEEQVANLKRSK